MNFPLTSLGASLALPMGKGPAATVADRVERLNRLDVASAAKALAKMPLEDAARVLNRPELSASPAIVAAMPTAKAARLLDAAANDRVADILAEIAEPVRSALLGALEVGTRLAVERLMHYPPRTVGSIMTTEFVGVPADWTVAQAIEHVRSVERSRETVYAIYVTDPQSHALTRVVTLRRLIMGAPEASILSVAQQSAPVTADPFMPQEEVAHLIRKHDLLALPVVDMTQQILGIVTVDDVIDTMIADSTEDVQKFGGMEALGKPYMQIGLGGMIRKRAGWLAALFLGEMLTASAMQYFQSELEKALVLTLFIPLIMSSGGNSGSQATSLLIRELALGQVKLSDWWRVALRELPAGLSLGLILGLIGVLRITVWQTSGLYDYGPHWMLLAATVCAALTGIVTFGSLAGSMLPFVLQKLGFDPASASAPFVATLVDVSGLVIYFSVALMILHGTLL
ncbi:MAG: magnesium transporter [Pararhizobium sp.]